MNSGIREEFRIGFLRDNVPLRSRPRNFIKSSDEHPTIIDNYLAEEISRRRVAGPFPIPPLANLHVGPNHVFTRFNKIKLAKVAGK